MAPENINTHHKEGHWKFQGRGGGSQQPIVFKGKYEAKLEISVGGGGGFKPTNLSAGEVWIFSGTTHCSKSVLFDIQTVYHL